MRNIKAIFTKQILSFFKKPAIISSSAAFLAFPIIFSLLITDSDPRELVNIFAIMFIGVSMIGTASSFLMEDSSTMNLRFMAMAGMRPFQYLIGTSSALLLIAFGALVIFSAVGGYFNEEMIIFLTLTMLGAAVSVLLGITLGLSRTTWLSQPLAMVLGFGPVISDTNERLANIFQFTYTQQVSFAIRDLSGDMTRPVQIVLANMAVILLVFILMNRKHGLDR